MMTADETRVETVMEMLAEVLNIGTELGVDLLEPVTAAARLVFGKAVLLDAADLKMILQAYSNPSECVQ
jgi:hypothetical protein